MLTKSSGRLPASITLVAPLYTVYCNLDVYFDIIKNIDFNEFDLYEVWAK